MAMNMNERHASLVSIEARSARNESIRISGICASEGLAKSNIPPPKSANISDNPPVIAAENHIARTQPLSSPFLWSSTSFFTASTPRVTIVSDATTNDIEGARNLL